MRRRWSGGKLHLPGEVCRAVHEDLWEPEASDRFWRPGGDGCEAVPYLDFSLNLCGVWSG